MRQQIILVVDDEPTIREVVRKYLERDGFAVAEAADGHQAITYLRDNVPDLIVLDIMLPGVDGMSITQRLRDPAGYAGLSVDGSIPIIMLTAKSEELHRIHGFEVGADDYVTKPFSPPRTSGARQGRASAVQRGGNEQRADREADCVRHHADRSAHPQRVHSRE